MGWVRLDSYPTWGKWTSKSHLMIARPWGRSRMLSQIDSASSVIMSGFNYICRKNFLWNLRKDIWSRREENKNNCERANMKTITMMLLLA